MSENNTTRQKIKILFVVKRRIDTYGMSLGLVNSAKFVSKALNHNFYIDSKLVDVVDGNAIDKEIHDYNPNYVFIEAIWCPPAKLKELANLYPRVLFSVRTHSKTPFIANEGSAFEYIKQYIQISDECPNIRLSTNHCDFNEDMSEVFDFRFDYLPNIYYPPGKRQTQVRKFYKKPEINISSFGAIRPLKNQLEQAVAAIRFANSIGKRLKFHINSNRLEQKGDSVLRNLRALFSLYDGHSLVEHDWMDHLDFIKLISKMDIAMQCSLSESYNICTSDAIFQGVPIVTSEEIDWVHPLSQCVATNTNDIIHAMRRVRLNKHLIKANQEYLIAYNDHSLKTWINHLKDMFEIL